MPCASWKGVALPFCLGLGLLQLRCAAQRSPAHPSYPSAEAVHAAFERVAPLATRCLDRGDRVTVEGFFEGRTGRFRVERVGVFQRSTRDVVRRCVTLQLEGARVRPFGALRHDARWTVADTVSPEVRAMLAAEGRWDDAPDRAGEIDVGALERVLGAQRGVFQRCYEFVARGDPSLRGGMRVRLTLSVDGRVTEGTFVHENPGLRDVGHCVVGHLRTVPFPRPREASVMYEFMLDFAPRDAGEATSSMGSR